MNLFKRFVSAIVGSKKAVTTVSTVTLILVRPLLKKIDLDISDEDLRYLIAIAGVYIGGQSVADFGKERTKLELSANSKKK